MSFWTAPILVAYLSTPNVAAGRNVRGVFEISKVNLVNDESLAVSAPLHKDVVWFDVYGTLAMITKKAGKREGSV